MARPVGTPFWGESLPPDDWTVLSGSADYVAASGEPSFANAGQAAQKWGEDDGLEGDDYAEVASAAEMLWIVGPADYLQTGDAADVFWLVRARGTGSITGHNDLDTTWAYSLPANSLGTQAVSSGGWTEFEFPTTEYSIADLTDPLGGMRFGLDVSGAVDIDVVQLRIWPPGGPLGGYGPAQTDAPVESSENPDVTLVTPELGDFEANYGDAYDDGVAAYVDGPESGFSFIGPIFAAEAIDEVVSSLGGTVHHHRWSFNSSYLSYDFDIAGYGADGYLAGEEGVDWIRRPDRTKYDLRSAWDFVSPSATPAVVGWLGNALEYEAHVGGAFTEPSSATFQVIDYVEPAEVGVERAPLITLPPAASPDSTEVEIVGEGDTGSVLLDLPLEPTFTIVAGHTWMHGAPTEPTLTGLTLNGEALRSSMTFVVGDGEQPLVALVQVPPYRVWKPGALSWVRHIQRNDGLGLSNWRWRSYVTVNVRVVGVTFSGFGSNQSIRWRGIR